MAYFFETFGDETYEWEVGNDDVKINKVRYVDEYHLISVDDIEYSDGTPLLTMSMSGLKDLQDVVESAADIYQDGAEDEVFESEDTMDAFEFAAHVLLKSFTWADTEEGGEFYDDLHDALQLASVRAEESNWELPEGFFKNNAENPFGYAVDVLEDAFNWSAAPEGYRFWAEVQDTLDELSAGGLPTYPAAEPEVYEQLDIFEDADFDNMHEDQPDLPPAVDRYFDALEEAKNEEDVDENMIVSEFETPHGTLRVEIVKVA